ncbi:3-hydroxyacyl-CoA dehydrogenase family protein [Desulforamulus ruminis]|uniref:3-hydroxybutyryl-CoA dehydrogenase n=1 Tax=Desulforamulus ruminis (strain ATCC 23193 / DSM 2154 / NCIMB 8452 / DL) TaxID=696281 RepID=F6DKL7_DESRL|nr:3-hydroxyacyl-CoA dehydrogenase family protein [Desulforamulus ruminis]AEG60392.1 3-hydroxyacyl-CoA dehydrogenase NAD-binding protein [Desulforamulus ruminis DSM 2154]
MKKIEEIKNICTLGTGTMGFGIALVFAAAGYPVRMFGRSEASIQRGLQNIKEALETFRENGLVDAEDIPRILERVKGVTILEEAVKDVDFVIEAIAENLAVKQQVFAQIEQLCSPETILATNTSGLSPTSIAGALAYKERFIAAHFWNPAQLIPLVEVVPSKYTSQPVVDATWQLMEKIGKKPVALNREALGFIGNRLQLALLREALYIVESGIASKEAVDTTVKYSLGRRLATTGPLESADLGGLDIFYNISTYLIQDLCHNPGVSPLLKEAMEKGKLGAKTGSGLYDWTPESLIQIKKTRENNLMEWLHKDKA